jgi:hypothetical protein
LNTFNKESDMNLNVLAYLLYLVLALPLTLWVGRTLHRHGQVFLMEVFRGDDGLAQAVNQLLVVGFYLVNLGFVALFMSSSANVDTGRRLLEVLSTKIGGAAVFIGLVHFANIWAFNAFRRRAIHQQSSPPAPRGVPGAFPPPTGSPYPPSAWPGWVPPAAPAPSPSPVPPSAAAA